MRKANLRLTWPCSRNRVSVPNEGILTGGHMGMTTKTSIATSCHRAVALGLFLTVVLTGCGGGGSSGPAPDTTKPTASIDQTNDVLAKAAPIVITFSESMKTSSLQLGGALAAESDGGVWSTTNHDNDTLTITPTSTWTSGTGRNISVDATDLAGNAVDTVSASYLVKLVFSNFAAATVEIGQADFSGSSPNQGGSPDANTLYYPYANPLVNTDGTLFIGDYQNNRVLGFNALPTVNNANADFVLGQPDFTTTTGNTSQTGMHYPEQIAMADGKMLVADSFNNRVLIYNSIPADGTAVPDVVLGQPDFTTNDHACDATHFDSAETVAGTPDGKVIVTDSNNSRVLIWNSVPTVNDQPPDLVLGQADFTHCISNDDNQDSTSDTTPSQRTLFYPAGVWSDGTRLVVLDYRNNRALIWNTFPVANFQAADLVLGQGDFTHNAENDDNQDGAYDAQPSARTLYFPYGGVYSNGDQLAIADYDNHRILIWNSFPTSNFQPADVVLGQSDFAHYRQNDDDQNGTIDGQASARVLHNPNGVYFFQDKLLVNDGANHRLLIFQSQ